LAFLDAAGSVFSRAWENRSAMDHILDAVRKIHAHSDALAKKE